MSLERVCHSITVIGTSLYVYGDLCSNSLDRLVNVNSLIGEHPTAYWETLMTANSVDQPLMLPLKDSEEILIFTNE